MVPLANRKLSEDDGVEMERYGAVMCGEQEVLSEELHPEDCFEGGQGCP